MNTSQLYSIYIPRISAKYNEQILMSLFHEGGIGFIKRVDFVEVEGMTFMNSAFVHFHYLYDIEKTKEIIAQLEAENGSFRWYVTEKEYWILLKNKNPIVDTVLNIHQIADIIKNVEKKSQEQEEKIKQQEEKLAALEAKIDSLLSVTK